MIVDVHAHIVPPGVLPRLLENAGRYGVRMEHASGQHRAIMGSFVSRPFAPFLSYVRERLEAMDQQGVDVQLLSGWVELFGYDLSAEDGARFARMQNEAMAEVVALHPERFVGMASVPLQDGALAAKALREAHGAGFKGAMSGTQPKGKGGVLDDSSLRPFWEAADALGALVFIHPVFESGDDRVHDYGMANAVGRITDTLIAVSRLIYAGHVTRYRNARIVAGIGGAALPYVVGRLRRNYTLDKAKLADPDAALAAMYYDTIVQDTRALRFLADVVGADRIMMGSDMPFPIGDLAPLRIVEDTPFSAGERASIDGGLAARLLGL